MYQQGLERQAASRKIHEVERIQVFLLQPTFLDLLEPNLQRNLELELVRSGESLYVTLPGGLVELTVEPLVNEFVTVSGSAGSIESTPGAGTATPPRRGRSWPAPIRA